LRPAIPLEIDVDDAAEVGPGAAKAVSGALLHLALRDARGLQYFIPLRRTSSVRALGALPVPAGEALDLVTMTRGLRLRDSAGQMLSAGSALRIPVGAAATSISMKLTTVKE